TRGGPASRSWSRRCQRSSRYAPRSTGTAWRSRWKWTGASTCERLPVASRPERRCWRRPLPSSRLRTPGRRPGRSRPWRRADMAEMVLVVDDDPDVARFVEVNLRSAGYRVSVATNGEEALSRALELRPDLVLLDVMMPRLD